MTVKTDFHAVDQQGTRDFVFQCHKRPFAMTVSPLFPNTPENLIDLELVEFLNIPIKKIEARRFHFAGIDTRIVGHISQTVQCVVKGKICGTTHLKAAVVRHMTKLFNLDCVAGGKTVKQLLSADILTNKSTVYTNTSAGAVSDKSDDEQSVTSSPKQSPSPVPTTPTSTTRSRPSGATTSPRPPRTPSSPPNTDLCDSWCYQGGKKSRFDTKTRRPVDKRWHYNGEDEIWTLPYTKSGPVMKPVTPDHTVAYIQLGNEDALTSFCNVVVDGWPMVASPKTEPTPSAHHAGSPSSPLTTDLQDTWCYQGGKDDRYDSRADCPVDKRWTFCEEEDIWALPYNRSGPILKPSTPDHAVAYIKLGNEDALTSFSNVVIDGWPKVVSPKTEPTPNIFTSVQAISSKGICGDCGNQASACQGTCSLAPYNQNTGFYQHISSVDPPYVMGHSGPPLPPDFSPCSSYCAYEDCDCVRRYAGRDWAS